MDLIAVMTYISLLAVAVILMTIGSNASASCNGPNVCNGRNGCNGHTNSDGHNGWDGYNCYITFLDIFGLSERPGTLT